MKKSVLISLGFPVALLSFSAFCSCAGKSNAPSSEVGTNVVSSSEIPYSVVSNYFINNDVDDLPEVINTQTEFTKNFGMAATMAEGGAPTAIDFDKQFVIVASTPVTEIATKITPVSLEKADDSLVFTCKMTQGEEQSYTTHPFVMVAVDKKYEAPVTVRIMK